MAIDKIITEKELNYIETLYIYANLQDFVTEINFPCIDYGVPLEDIQSGIVYRHVLSYYYDTLLSAGEYIGEANGRMWYKFDNYRLGIMEHDKAKIANQFNVEIQYTQSHMFSLGSKLEGLELPFDGTLDQYHIKRIDISQIVKTPIDYLTNHDFISSYRAMDRFSKNGKTETVYLGHRKNGNVFRMYNKTIELKANTIDHPIDYKKIELFSKYFGDIENLYTFELELHRKYLRPTFGIDTLADLEKVYKAYSEIVGKIKIYKDTDLNRKMIANKHHDRIEEFFVFTEYREFKRINKKKYKPSKNYAVDKAVNAIESYSEAMGSLTEAEKLLILDEIGFRLVGRDIDIHIGSSDYEEMQQEHEGIRNSQTSNLGKEANRVFAPIMLQKVDEVF